MRQSTESILLDISCDSKRETQAAVKEASDQKTAVVRFDPGATVYSRY